MPLTEQQIDALHASARDALAELRKVPLETIPANAFTCADCAQASTCEYAFDLYNTDGDCLAEK